MIFLSPETVFPIGSILFSGHDVIMMDEIWDVMLGNYLGDFAGCCGANNDVCIDGLLEFGICVREQHLGVVIYGVFLELSFFVW